MFTLAHIQKINLRLLLVCAFVLMMVPAQQLWAATLQIAPATGSYSAGQTFTTAIRINPGGQSVNSAEATLSFDPAVLSVVSISKDGSVFSIWTTEPTFSNSAGTLTFGGGTPTPFSSQSNLVNVTFRAVAAGSGSVRFTDALVLANDGAGTDVYRSGTPATFTVGAASATPPPAPTPTPATPPAGGNQPASEEAIVFGDPPRAPEVGSQAFLEPDRWYSLRTGIFTWTLPFDVDAVAVRISTSSDSVPSDFEDAIFNPAVDEFAVTPENVQDGIQYLSIQYRNQVGWGAVTNRRLQIDTTPPEPFTIGVRVSNSASGFPQLNFAAEDETSGIDFYVVTIADKEPFQVTPDEAQLGYILRDLEDGTYTATVVAHDRAGNTREAKAAVQVTAGWVRPVEELQTSSFWDFFTFTNLLIVFLFIVIGLLVLLLLYTRKQNFLREEKLRRETKEIQDQMEKIFSALRDEIYDQINAITKRKRLSKKEKEAVEGLNQALEVSETLIEKEINDVKSILK